MPGGFLPGEEPALRVTLAEALAQKVVTPVDPARLPGSPRGPPPARVVLVPAAFLRQRGLARVVNLLGAYTLHTPHSPVIFLTEETFARLDTADLLDELLWIEIDDRVLGLRTPAQHQRHVDELMRRLPIRPFGLPPGRPPV